LAAGVKDKWPVFTGSKAGWSVSREDEKKEDVKSAVIVIVAGI
jgi:hypothetical protein